MKGIYNNECPLCGGFTFQRDTKKIIEVLELGTDRKWSVLEEIENDTGIVYPYIYCNNCFCPVELDKNGKIIDITEEVQDIDSYE